MKKAYPQKKWSVNTLNKICRRIDKTGSAVERKIGSGRPKSARSNENINKVQELICSQEGQPGTSSSTRQVATEIGISATSVRRIAKMDLSLSSFKRMPVQVINDATRVKRLTRSKMLLRRLTVQKAKRVFFTDEKIFYLNPPVNSQNNRVWSMVYWCNVPNFLLTLWYLQGSVTVANEGYTLLQKKQRLMQNTT